MKVFLSGDRMRTYLLLTVQGRDLAFEIDGRLSSEDGYIQFDPTSGTIGSISLPQASLRSAVQRIRATHQAQFKLPDGIREVKVENGMLVIVGQ